jgi:hypothetical protein
VFEAKQNSRFLRNGVAAIATLCSALTGATDLDARQRVAAVDATIAAAKECKSLGDFYWEIGDKNGARGSGAVGKKYNADNVIAIASASKWIFGSYVLEKIGAHTEPSAEQVQALEMQSGYTGLKFGHCFLPRTVAACFHNRGNDEFKSEYVGKFFYNGGHDQKLAVDLGLGDLNVTQFGDEIKKYLGRDLDIGFNSPQPAGGMKVSPSDYGKFLRKILNGDLRMHDYLDFEPVCTLPKKCSAAVSSPVPAAWHYSLNHWIEDSSDDDGAFSSPGAFGFYPWISVDKKWYGILAREDRTPNAAKESVYCGVKLRAAWLSGATQK